MNFDLSLVFFRLSQACEPKIAQRYTIIRIYARKNAKIFDIFAFLAVLVILGEYFFAKKHKTKETSV